jgi:ankyrin repeat protein
VAALLAVPDTQVNWQSSKGITAISAAAHKGRIGIVQQLIDARADVNIESNNGSTPLIQASHFGHAEVVSMLIRANANVDKPNNKGTTALMRATQEGKEEVRPRTQPLLLLLNTTTIDCATITAAFTITNYNCSVAYRY